MLVYVTTPTYVFKKLGQRTLETTEDKFKLHFTTGHATIKKKKTPKSNQSIGSEGGGGGGGGGCSVDSDLSHECIHGGIGKENVPSYT